MSKLLKRPAMIGLVGTLMSSIVGTSLWPLQASAFSTVPQESKVGHRDSAPSSDELQDTVERLIQLHNQSFLERNLAEVISLYDEDFVSDLVLPVLDRDAMERLYERLLAELPEVKVVCRADRVGNFGPWATAFVEMLWTQDGFPDSRFCFHMVADVAVDPPRIARLFETSGEQGPTITEEGSSHSNLEYLFEVELPPGYLLVQPVSYLGRFVDWIQLIGVDLDSEISIGLLPPRINQHIQELLESDSEWLKGSCHDYSVETPTQSIALKNWSRALITDAQLQITENCPLAARTPGRGHVAFSRAYLSPDDRAVFRLFTRGMRSSASRLQKDLRDLCQNIELKCEPRQFWDTVSANHGWGLLDEDNRYALPALGLTCTPPKGWRGELIPTSDTSTLLLECVESPRESFMSLRVGPWPSEYQDAKSFLEDRLQCVGETQCDGCVVTISDEKESSCNRWPADYMVGTIRNGEGGLIRHHAAFIVRAKEHFVWLGLHVRDREELNFGQRAFDAWIISLGLER